MDNLKAKFTSNKITETERVIHTAKQVWGGFYSKKGFVVLPELTSKIGGVVVLPDIGLEKITDVENFLQQTKLNFPIKTNPEFLTKVESIVKTDGVEDKIVDYIRNEWEKIEKEFWGVVKIIVPESVNKLESLEIRVTAYGSISSYKFMNKSDYNLIVYLRKDGGISSLAEAILTGLVYPYIDKMGLTWEECEAIVDFALKNSVLSKIFSEYTPTLFSLRSGRSKEILNISRKYLEKLKIRSETNMKIVNNGIELFGKSIEKQLTDKQSKLLKELLKNDKKILTFDEVGNILWPDDSDKYSLWAVNKFIERLRSKLVDLGLSPYNLKTLRGRGCCLDI